ncbi:hypothetical protein L596_023521 [Steinernema carpocapsae]|uniref:ACB domain-containing protein n=1 Tax=Steinernema carpocapsae TaxID=34508 RepID=A0A4U5MDW0_STECR|nr:hypothetical protein L596_023521 [Steinernema carpocapsae]
MSSGVSADDLFSAAVGVVHNLPLTGPVKITNEEKLAYYGLYKHATEGPCSRPKPGLMDIIEAFKWDAWNRLRETSQNEAKQRYADLTREKIRKANREFKMQDWMGHEDWNRLEPILLPKLRLLVPELVDKYEVARSEVIPSDPEPRGRRSMLGQKSA